MTNCSICHGKASDDIHLSDGSMIHESCLDLFQNNAIKMEEILRELQNTLIRLQREYERRQGIGFKIVSIFSKPEVESTNIEKAIPVIKEKIAKSSNVLSAIDSRLASIYDHYLTYPPDWDERKNEVIRRDGENCAACTSWRRLHLHHITPLSRGGSNRISNLKLLCEDCHSKEHGGRNFTDEFVNSETAFSKRVSTIGHAIERGERIEFGYKKPGEESYKKRTIKPLELVNIDHRRDNDATLCVLGFCELRNANRHFALKRMRELKVI